MDNTLAGDAPADGRAPGIAPDPGADDPLGADADADGWAALLPRVRTWIEDDPDPRTRDELTALLGLAAEDTPSGAGARTDIADRFAGTLQFGTAGLRGALGAGPNRMNRAVVTAAAAGLARYLHDELDATPGAEPGGDPHHEPDAGTAPGARDRSGVPVPAGPVADGPPRVVVGFDARHGSATFAGDSAAVLTAAGCQVWLLPRPLPTPVLAFAVRHLRADAGVMVTASHNPPQDNGYKVYLGGRVAPGPGTGVQIVPPADAGIAARIAAAGPAASVPRADGGWTVLGEEIVDGYLAGAAAVVPGPGPRDLDAVLTPLHGVGGDTVSRALTGAGFPAPYLVPSQAAPDPDFPTVTFPNPEEPGAIDLAVAAARERGARLVLANDPDADRCAVAVPDPVRSTGTGGRPGDGSGGDPGSGAGSAPDGGTGWRMLRGDELGALLGEHVLARAARTGGLPERVDGYPPTVASSIVSSQLLGRIAAAHGVRHVETLTGFKWIARVPGLVYGYEEALGYCVAPSLVRDKDGITAALLIAELAAQLAADGRTLLDALDDLAARHGVHDTDQLSIRVSDLSLITAALDRLRAEPPRVLAGAAVTSVDDLRDGGPGLPPTDGVRWRTADGARVVVRPSGTEPKLKCYLEVVLPPGGKLDVDRRVAAARLLRIRTDLQEQLALGG
ncbi:MAG: phospho-sugar mutase [Kineosporiaceae bacterium]